MRLLPGCVLLVGCVLLAAFAPSGPRQEERASITKEIEALIEKTDAYQRFRAVYEIVPEDEGRAKSTLELTYAAPDRAGVCASGEMDMKFFVVGNRCYIEMEGEEHWKTFELENFEVPRVLEEAFPSENPLGEGISFSLGLRDGFDVSVSNSPTARAGLLLWLPSMSRASEKVTEELDHLVWTGDAFRLALSRKSGFPDEIRVEKEGRRAIVTLVELQLDEEAAGGLELPEEARSAVLDEAAGEQVERSMLASYRATGFLRLESRLEAGTVAWNSRTTSLWEEFLESLHRELVARTLGAWASDQRDRIDRMCVWVRECLDEQDTPERREQLRKEVAAKEEKLAKSLGKAMEKYLEDLPKIGSSSAEPRDELFAVEREVVERLNAELVSKPTLDYLREQAAAALGKEER